MKLRLAVIDKRGARITWSKSGLFFYGISCVVLSILTLPSLAIAQVQGDEAQVVPGEFIVKYRSDMRQTRRALASAELNVETKEKLDLVDVEVVTVRAGEELDLNTAKDLLASGEIEYIQPNYIYTIDRSVNDARFSELWGMHNSGQTGGSANIDIDAPEAWDITTGSTNVVVGVIDTGIEYTHPDLAANMWTNTAEIPGNNLDDDSNGYIDDVYGMNALNSSGNPLDDNGHGTHCAGTIGGRGNDGVGVVGVNWNVKLMGLKFLNQNGQGATSGAIQAINYAITMKQRGVNLRVLSNSWGGSMYDRALEEAVQAAQNNGILFVAAAGNAARDNDSSATYPANYEVDNVVSVAAIDASGNLATFSNYGALSVDIAAPGVSILSSFLGGTYKVLNGTSMATPHAAGVAALILAQSPSLSLTDLKARLLATKKPLPGLVGVIANAGMVDAYQAVTNTVVPDPNPIPQVHYNRIPTNYNFDGSLGTRVLQVDDGYAPVALGFTFPYCGGVFNNVAVSANGRIVPMADSNSLPNSGDYQSKLDPGINILHQDYVPAAAALSGGASGVYFKQLGTEATITWVVQSYAHRNSQDPATVQTFQARLKATGAIEFHYADTHSNDQFRDYGALATVGLQAVSGTSCERLAVSQNSPQPDLLGNSKALGFALDRSQRLDFDGDSKSDLAVFRPATAMWFVLTSASNFDYNQQIQMQWGLPGDKPVPGDFDGDKKTDFAVYRASEKNWYIRKSSTGATAIRHWGNGSDQPVVGDFDGDGVDDIAVFRKSKGAYYALKSSANILSDGYTAQDQAQSVAIVKLASVKKDNRGRAIKNTAKIIPIPGDFAGEGKSAFGIIEISKDKKTKSAKWIVKRENGKTLFKSNWGKKTDAYLACDWEGNGTADRVAIRKESSGLLGWYVATREGPRYTLQFGEPGDTPSCNKDFNGDGIADKTVFRTANATWYIIQPNGTFNAIPFGLSGDVAL